MHLQSKVSEDKSVLRNQVLGIGKFSFGGQSPFNPGEITYFIFKHLSTLFFMRISKIGP